MGGRVVPVSLTPSLLSSFILVVTVWWQNSGCCLSGPRLCLWQEPEEVTMGNGECCLPDILRYSSHVPLPMGTGAQLQKEVEKWNFLAGMLLPCVIQVREQG